MFVPEVRKAIKRSLLAGNSFDAAARAGGVQARALYRWFRLWPDWRKRCERWRRTGRLRPVRAYGTNGASAGTYSVDNILGDKPEERRARMIEYRERNWSAKKWNKEDREWLYALCVRRASERGVTVATYVKKLVEMEREGDRRRAEQAAKPAVSQRRAVGQDASSEVLEARILPYLPETPANAPELPVEAEIIEIQEPHKNESAATGSARRLIGGRSPASRPVNPGPHELGTL
jgi:hypothetical protein